MHKIHRSCLAVTLAVAMVLGMSPAQGIRAEETKKTGITAAETRDADGETKYERIDIGTAEEFADFASKCYLDAWSENKYVSLTADIDLTGTQLCVVPVFNGIFDGVGHTISGFDYLGDGYVVGLFRYVERDGMIQNLTLKGDIESANQRECIGSICGVNYGTIKNCTFQGTVSGRDTVGGIAGVNGGTGIITGCTAKGRITGYYSTGGIAGINHGVLNYCSNRAGINDDSAWVEEDDEMGTGMGILESLTENDDNELYSGVDTGGIAGFSDGMIVRCTNSGTVGYEHTGYNIGGIAGRQSGVVSHSTNNGTVYGRKDIGGIVGQMEPYIEIHEAESIRKAVNKLHDLIDKTIDDMQATKDSVKRDFDTLTVYSDSAVDAADVLAEQLGDFVDDNLDQVQAVTDRLDRVMAMTPEVLNDFEAAENSFTDAVQALKNISGDLGKMTDISDAPYDISSRKRITLLHTVGGYVVSSSYNPDAGEEVEITARTDGSSREYRLSRIEVVKVTNGETIASSTSDTCVFTMPAENVRVEAYFEPDAGILVQRKAAVIDDADAEQESPETETESEIETETETELETETETASKTETETGSDVETESGSDAETETGSDAETETGSDAETEGSTELDSATDNSSAESDRTEDDRVENNGNSSSGNRYDSTTPSDIAMPYGAGAAFLSGAFGDESEDDSGNGSAANKGGSINNSSNSTAAKASDSGSNTASGKNNGGNNTVVKASGSGNNTSDNKNNNINSIAGRVSDNSNNTAGGKNNGSNSTVSRASGSSNNTIEGNNNGSINDSGDNTLDSKNNGSNGTAGNASDSGNDASDEKDNNSNETGNAAGNKDPNTGDDTDNSSNDAADNKDNNSNSTANNNNNGSNDTADNKDNNSNNATDNKDNNTNDEDDGTDNSSDGTDSGKDPDTDKDSAATPDKDRRPAARAAATVRLTSNLSGNAGCTPNKAQDRAVVAVEPSGGYTVEYVTVDGTRIAPDSGNSYSFPVEGGETYEVYVHFRKVATRSGTVENAKSEIEYAIREAQDAANKIRDGIEANDEIDISELQKMLSATTTVMENTEILADIYGEQVAEALKAVNRDLGSTSDHLKSALDSVKAATRHTRDIVDYVNAQPDIRFAKLGAEYDYNRTNLHNQLQGISDSLKILSDNASNYSDVVNADLKAVNDQINVIFNLLADRLSDVQKLGLEEFYEDVSDEDIDSITTGRTESCSNRGIVKGDINVGGIAGSMSIDDEDPEDSAAGAIEYELGRRFITKCLVTGSVNEGYVTAKKNGAGGICGYMNHGIIVDSESYGSVESTEGD